MTNNHTFNKSAYEQSDIPARRIVKEYFSQLGFSDFRDGSQYGVDLVNDELGVVVELEHRQPFKEEFPFNTYHFLARKKHHFTEPHKGYRVWFMVLNHDFTKLLAINTDKILPYLESYKRVTVKCKNNYNDDFYHVPISEFTIKNINN